MNLKVVASGMITLPNGKKKPFYERFTFYHPEHNTATQAILCSADPYQTYRFIYEDPESKLLNWIREREAEGFTVEWLSEG